MSVSIIVPVLDEARLLPETIAHLRSLQPPAEQVIVVDGGSTDGSREWLARNAAGPSILVLDSARGRGMQMNAAAAAASGDILLFLHADARLPADAIRRVEHMLADPAVAGGAFTLRFAATGRSRLSMRIIGAGISARTLATRSATGDQAIFVRREAFEVLGGYRSWPLFEDVELVARLKKVGRFGIVRSPVTVSSRRYNSFGPWRTTLLMWWLRVRYWLGATPEELKRHFADVRHERRD